IASKGGSLDDQVRRAQSFALAEEKTSPKQVKGERICKIDSQGNLSIVTLTEKHERHSTSTTTSETTLNDAPNLVASNAPKPATKTRPRSAQCPTPSAIPPGKAPKLLTTASPSPRSTI